MGEDKDAEAAAAQAPGRPDPRDERPPRDEPRRRPRPQRSFDSTVPSPCIAVCEVDPASSLCIGCLRHLDEIRDWPIMTAEQKRAVLAALPGRR